MTQKIGTQHSTLAERIGQLLERHDALVHQLRDIQRQHYVLMQRAARIKLQLAQRGLAALQRD